jgi:integrase
MFWETKGGRPRPAALPPAAVVTLANLPGEREGHVFRRPDGEPYASKERLEGGQIKTAFATACRRAGFGEWAIGKDGKRFVPDLTPHCLRHTWATWFYALSKDPFLLRDEGGWATVKMVERYAHLMSSEHAAGIAAIWGPTHPRIGELPTKQGGKGAKALSS